MKQINFRGAGRGGALAGVLLGLTACAGEGTGEAGSDITANGGLDAGAVPTASLSPLETDTVGDGTRQLPDPASALANGNDVLPQMPRTEIGVEPSTTAPVVAAATPVTVEPVAETPFELAPAPDVEPEPTTTADVGGALEPIERQVAAPEPEAVVDAVTDADSDIEPTFEAAADLEPVVEKGLVADNDVEAVIEPDSEIVAEAEPVVEPESETVAEAEPAVEPESETVAEAEPVVEPESETLAEAEPVVEPESEPEFVAEAEPEAETVAEAEPESAAALPVDDGYSVRISWNPAAGSDLGYYVYYGADDESVGTMARSITRDEADAGGDLRTALLDAPGDIDTGIGSRVCFSISAWNSTGETARSPVRCVDTPSS